MFRELDRSGRLPVPAAHAFDDVPVDETGLNGPGQRRFYRFEAVTDGLIAAADPDGLVVVLDDLHWAGPGTLQMLVHLARSATPSRLMVVATYRDTETVDQGPLRAALADLGREPAVSRIGLTGWTMTEVAARLLSALPIGSAEHARIWARRAGDAAMAQLAWEEAGSWYRRAADVRCGTAPERAELLLSLARAQIRAYDVDGARMSIAEVAAIGRSLGDSAVIGRAVLVMEGVTDFMWDRDGRRDVPSTERLPLDRINPPDLHDPSGYHHVTVVPAGRSAHLAGQCPIGADGRLVGPGDLNAQIDQVVANSLIALRAAGTAPDQVIRSVVYVVSTDQAELAVAWRRLLASKLGPAFTSAATLLGVAALGYSGQLIEVDLTAALPA